MGDRLVPIEHPAGLAAAADLANKVGCPKYPRFHFRPIAHCARAPEALEGYPDQVAGSPCPLLRAWVVREVKPDVVVDVRPFCGHPRPLQVARIYTEDAAPSAAPRA